jgi:hypothetical protein
MKVRLFLGSLKSKTSKSLLPNKLLEQTRTIFAQIFKRVFHLMGSHAKEFSLLQVGSYKTWSAKFRFMFDICIK